MALGRQAKTLSKAQIEAVVGFLNSTRYPLRNRVIFFLSVKAGLRAKEIANLTWPMITDPTGMISDFNHTSLVGFSMWTLVMMVFAGWVRTYSAAPRSGRSVRENPA